MENEGRDQSTQGVLDFKCKKILPVEKKSSVSPAPGQSAEIVEKNYSVDSVAFPTPEKTAQSSRTKNKVFSPLREVKQDEGRINEEEAVELPDKWEQDEGRINEEEAVELPDKWEQDEGRINEEEAVELPDKYKTIAEFFDRIGSSVRLLRLYKKLPTFQNICTQVEVLSKRKLSYSHLAQIKYMLPEFIQIEKTLVHDEKTLCMKPDLKVTLLLDVVKAHPDHSPFMVLRQVFHSKLLAFFNSNPEDSDIPEVTLPVLIGQKNETCSLEPLPTESCINSNPAPIEVEPLSNLSHLSPCFNSRFSQKVIVPDTEKTQLLASTLPLLPVNSGDGTDQEISSQEKSLQEKVSSFLDSKTSSSKSHADLIFNPRSSICSSAFEDSPSSVLDPRQLRIATPVQSTPPRRTMPSSDDKINSRTRMSSHTAAKRSLDFLSPLEEGEESASSFIVEESKQDRDNRLKTDPSLSALMQTGEETTTKMSQTVFARKQRMLASLLDLFNLIHRIFQSVKCSSITKQELLHKIILENCDIVETREVEEQLELLEELVPDWICRKLVPSGDLLYSIKKVSDLESIRARLVDAV